MALKNSLSAVARHNETCKRLIEIPGVGPLIATAAVVTMGEASAFKSGREFAAYVGLVPKQTGSGGKVRLPEASVAIPICEPCLSMVREQLH